MKKFLLYIFFLATTNTSFAQNQLIFSIDLIRHGDRTPTYETPISPYPWKEGLSALTVAGVQQQIKLGKQLRKLYIDQYHLLPISYEPETLYVRSTNKSRTLRSAEAFLLGLYPLGSRQLLPPKTADAPNTYQTIPIHTIALEQENLLATEPSKVPECLPIKKQWHDRNALLQKKFNRWNQLTGFKITTIRELEDQLGDNLKIRKLHHIKFPAGMTKKEVEEIISISDWSIIEDFKCVKTSYPFGKNFLKMVSQQFKNVYQGKTSLKYMVFFGHDVSILSIMNTLGTPLNLIPGYNARLNFSLFKNNNKYYVKMSLNDVPINISGCEYANCPLDQFLWLLHEEIIKTN